jgi:ABC-2 type transport system ATP-binding protein
MKALSISDLRKSYAGGVTALKGISLEVEEGDFFALLGPNGAGKSTTIGILSCLVNKTHGKVEVFGTDLDRHPEKVKSQIGLVPQEYNFNIFEKSFPIIVNQAGYYGIPRNQAKERAKELLQKLDLWGKRDAVSRTLSGGMKRKLMIVRALVHRPKLLILDEPTAGVDVETRREMWDFLKEMNKEGTSIILTTHYLEEAEQLCRNIAIINHGVIVENTTMKKLLSTLDKETFILDLRESISEIPSHPNFKIEKTDEHTLKVEVAKDQDLNDILLYLHEKGIKIMSMRNEQNRLEELFIRLTKKNDT